MNEDRILFRILADPIKHYLMENGIDQLSAGLMSAEIADRQLKVVKTKLQVVAPKSNVGDKP